MSSNVFTEQDAAQIRGRLEYFMVASLIDDIVICRVEPQGKFMNIFAKQKIVPAENRLKPFFPSTAGSLLTYALNDTLSYRGWTPVQASAMREGDALCFRFRIEKTIYQK